MNRACATTDMPHQARLYAQLCTETIPLTVHASGKSADFVVMFFEPGKWAYFVAPKVGTPTVGVPTFGAKK